MSPSNQAALLTLIDSEYKKIAQSNSNKEKYFSFSSIIQLKQSLNHINKPEIYTDIKGFIKYYILATDEAVFNYDLISFAVLERNIIINDIDAKLSLHSYALKLLKSNGYDEAAKECQNTINDLALESLKGKPSLCNYIHIFYLTTTKSAYSIAISIAASIFISTIALLPSQTKLFQLVEYKNKAYSKIYYFNRLLNTIVVMLGLDDDVKIKPLNFCGVILMIAGKAIFLLIIGNILFKQFKSRFNLE